MSRWIGEVMRDRRVAAQVTLSEVAAKLRISESRVSGFERDVTWPRDIDAMLSAYADCLGVDDSRSFWFAAYSRWIDEGEPPELPPASQRAVDIAREAAANARTTRARAESPGGRNATQGTRREAG